MLFREPALLAQTEGLTAEDFSVPLFGRVYAALRERWQNDLAITPAALADSLSPAEMAHLTAVLRSRSRRCPKRRWRITCASCVRSGPRRA